MQQALQLAALALLAVLLVKLVPRSEYGVLLIMIACVYAGALLLESAKPMLALIEELEDLTDLDPAVLAPLLKVLGITLVCRFGAAICTDTGQKALGDLVRQAGEVLSLYAALPLMRSALAIIQKLTGG